MKRFALRGGTRFCSFQKHKNKPSPFLPTFGCAGRLVTPNASGLGDGKK